MQLKFKRWVSSFDFRSLSHLDGTLPRLVKRWGLRENDAVVVTSMGWHRLRIIAVMGQHAVMIVPDTPAGRPDVLEMLAKWAAESLRDGVVCLSEYKQLMRRAA